MDQKCVTIQRKGKGLSRPCYWCRFQKINSSRLHRFLDTRKTSAALKEKWNFELECVLSNTLQSIIKSDSCFRMHHVGGYGKTLSSKQHQVQRRPSDIVRGYKEAETGEDLEEESKQLKQHAVRERRISWAIIGQLRLKGEHELCVLTDIPQCLKTFNVYRERYANVCHQSGWMKLRLHECLVAAFRSGWSYSEKYLDSE